MTHVGQKLALGLGGRIGCFGQVLRESGFPLKSLFGLFLRRDVSNGRLEKGGTVDFGSGQKHARRECFAL